MSSPAVTCSPIANVMTLVSPRAAPHHVSASAGGGAGRRRATGVTPGSASGKSRRDIVGQTSPGHGVATPAAVSVPPAAARTRATASRTAVRHAAGGDRLIGPRDAPGRRR